ncbi:MAG: polysaccharide deacetylase family protein [Bacteroidales bacterium]
MIYLTFDTEEFDCPLPYSQTLSFEKQMEISSQGTTKILDLLSKKGVRATFFCTAIFAISAPQLIHRIVAEGHEVASHGFYHNKFEIADLKKSKEILEEISGQEIHGFRMANMRYVDLQALADAGYKYDSSLNPIYLPGHYNNLSKPRRIFQQNGLYEIPASASSLFRTPLFWLSMHNLPLWLYAKMCLKTVQKDGYLNLYLHPWEFVELDSPSIDLAWYIKRNSGQKLLSRLELLIDKFQNTGLEFGVLKDCQKIFS